MFHSTLKRLTAFVISICVVIPALAQTPSGPNRTEQRVGERGAVGIRALAYELYSYGKEAKDALAVVTAVSLMTRASATETKRGEKKWESVKNLGVDKAAQLTPPDRAAMLATARALASKNERLLAMIEDLDAATTKSALVGPQWSTDIVAGGTTNTYAVTFRGGETAEIAIFTDGNAPIRLRVIDENDNEVCVRNNQDKRGLALYCSWRPKWTGPFHIKIKNNGKKDIAFRVEVS